MVIQLLGTFVPRSRVLYQPYRALRLKDTVSGPAVFTTSLVFLLMYINKVAAQHGLQLQNCPRALPGSFGFIGSVFRGFSTPLGFSLAMYKT